MGRHVERLRAEHVASTRSARFRSLDELPAILADRLADADETGES